MRTVKWKMGHGFGFGCCSELEKCAVICLASQFPVNYLLDELCVAIKVLHDV